MAASLSLTVLLLAIQLSLLTNRGLCWKCNVNATVCDIYLELKHHVTMMKEKMLTVGKDGLLFPYDTTNFSSSNAVDRNHVITGDGWPEPRVVIAVNGTVPGPVIEVHEHQTVRVHLTNKMESEASSLHFHGQFQRGTPFMDGVSYVTQCPVLPGQTFVHKFKAEPAGTFWYHGHTGDQANMGVNGAFIVHPRSGASEKYYRQFPVLVQDYNHDWDSIMDFLKMKYGMFTKGKKLKSTSNLSGGRYSMFRIQSVLFNGRGRYLDPDTRNITGAPLETFPVRQGELYRFRFIASGAVFPLEVSVDGHKLRVVSTDGLELRDPQVVDSVILVPGERYDFELNATEAVANYWIRAKTLEVEHDHVGWAVLHYEGAPENTDPTTNKTECTSSLPCKVVNCPFLYWTADHHKLCINANRLRSAEGIPSEIGLDAHNVKEYFLNFAFPGTTVTPSSVNGIKFQFPHVSAQTQPREVHTRCPGDGYRCVEDELCFCTNVLDLQKDEVVQLVISNLGRGKGWDHPMHMHGHSYWVLKVGYPDYNNVTGRFVSQNPDIDCRGNNNTELTFCNHARWANANWTGNSVPGLELEYPLHKDTINVPTGGYVVVRIKADNPGVWAMHCHVSLHSSDGMFMLLNESFPDHPAPPPGFPTCGSFYAHPAKEVMTTEKPSSAGSRIAVSESVMLATMLVAVMCDIL
ncbi:uncharacterized protein [Littorina saxatilis]|uniref:Uncharacterized protein n=1 Tax=Littorina saxatilis TaxID=31220 RepID=A0AAN9BDH6_9CAEN